MLFKLPETNGELETVLSGDLVYSGIQSIPRPGSCDVGGSTSRQTEKTKTSAFCHCAYRPAGADLEGKTIFNKIIKHYNNN